jgi:hypothetical protein
MQAIAERSTGVITSEPESGASNTASIGHSTPRLIQLPFDASALLVALAAAIAAPSRSSDLHVETSAIFADLSWNVMRAQAPQKSATEDDAIYDSPNWLSVRLAALEARGFHRRHSP